jgi:hypothetical protein
MPRSDVPPGYAANAVKLVRDAAKLKGFAMVRALGITATELGECQAVPRWPHSENARAKLISLAREHGVDIGQSPPEGEPNDEQGCLF